MRDHAAQSGATAGGGAQTVNVPDIGDFNNVDVIEVLVEVGDTVAVEDALMTLETDKATMDVPSTHAGEVTAVHVAVGDKVSQGSKVVDVAASGGAKSAPASAPAEEKPAEKKSAAQPPAKQPAPAAQQPAKQQAPAAEPRSAPATNELPPIDEAGFSQAHASPSVRKLARELGVNLAQVKGSGEKSRVLHEDVKAFVKRALSGQGQAAAAGGAALPKVPSIDFAKFGEVDVQKLTRIQKISGPRLQASWINLPHVTQHDLADITNLEARRQKLKGPAKERGISLTPLAFVIKACISALKEFPKVNASLSNDGESLVFKKYYHVGFAADTDQGLVVPVIRNADTMDVYELAAQLGELSKAARDGKLKGEQMQGASFTISSLGGIGGTAFTPIVNAPEVAILGVSKSTMQPVWNGEAFDPKLMLPLSFSYDHRVIDGAYAVRFTTFLSQTLGNVDALLEAIP
ncbi:MAG: dihydrolipoyllysine-residue acetyltransferase [Woeseia sp.]|nr:dihydrolipoyllysine-residue acetyltransferase [Woeseia sp.]